MSSIIAYNSRHFATFLLIPWHCNISSFYLSLSLSLSRSLSLSLSLVYVCIYTFICVLEYGILYYAVWYCISAYCRKLHDTSSCDTIVYACTYIHIYIYIYIYIYLCIICVVAVCFIFYYIAFYCTVCCAIYCKIKLHSIIVYWTKAYLGQHILPHDTTCCHIIVLYKVLCYVILKC